MTARPARAGPARPWPGVRFLRRGIEGFSAAELAIVTSGCFVGFLSGTRQAPVLIRRVGHVRVFAALGSFMSAGPIAFTLQTDPRVWTLLRVLIGFCMSAPMSRPKAG